jgi:hypothetical protein
MAWHVGTLNGIEMFSHDGLSTGHRAFIGIAPAMGRAVVALINGIAPIGLTDIGRRLLNADYPLFADDCALLRPARSAPPTYVDSSSQSLRGYVGIYQMTPRVRVEALIQDACLVLELDGDIQRVYPQGKDEFWLPANETRLDCLVRFERVDEQVTAMVVADPASTRRLMLVGAHPARVWYGRSASEGGAIALDR